MNKNILKYLMAFMVMGFLVACEADDFNKDHLDGWTPGVDPVEVQTLNMTLSDADYKAIANNQYNKELAEKNGVAQELAALAKSKHFSSTLPAQDYIPAFLEGRGLKNEQNQFRHLSNGSRIMVTYNILNEEMSESLTGMLAAASYNLAAEDYKIAWGEEVEAAYFTPEKNALVYLPSILKKNMVDPVKGDYVIARYDYSATEPQIGGGSNPEEDTYAQIGSLLKGQNVTVKGKVSAGYGRGFILDDGTGAILVYMDRMANNFTLGDELVITGEVGEYNNGLQFGNTAEIKKVGKTQDFAFGTAKKMGKAELDAFGTDTKIQFASINGTLKIEDSGKGFFYYNVDVEGADVALQYVMPGQIDQTLNGQQVTVEGYAFAYNAKRSSTSLMMTSIAQAGQKSAVTPIGVVATRSAAAEATVIGQVAAINGKNVVLNDATGSVLCYFAEAAPAYTVGQVLKVTGNAAPYDGFNQFKNPAVEVLDEAAKFTAPEARVMTAEDVNQLAETGAVQHIAIVGTLAQNEKGYYELVLDGTLVIGKSRMFCDKEAIDASLVGQQVVMKGYLIGYSEQFKNMTTIVLSVESASTSASAAALFAVATEKHYVAFKYDGSSWDVAKDCVMVDPADYKQMGANDNNFSSSFSADTYLPMFLNQKFPYALEGDVKVVGYHFYDKKAEKVITMASEYTMLNGEWTKTEKITTFEGPFKKINNEWKFDPSLTVVLDPMGNEFTVNFMQSAVDWVFANIDPLKYKGKYDNTEYYAGFSSHYKNISWKIYEILQYWGGEDKAGLDISKYDQFESADEKARRDAFTNFYAEIEKHTAEVLAATLNQYYADVKMIAGLDIIYTVRAKFYAPPVVEKDVNVPTHEMQFKLVSDGQFEYIEGSFKALDPSFELMSDENFAKYQHK